MNKQRKLTWIEKKQIERIAFDHPFFDMHGTVLSKKEAKAIIRSTETRKSGIEIVSEACDRVGIPRPDSVDNRSSIFDNLKEIFSIPMARRIGIIAIALILLIVFFAVTPTGKAIAESLIQYIVSLFDDGRLVINQSDNDYPMVLVNDENEKDGEYQDDENDYVYIESFDAFSEVTGKTPVKLPLQYSEIYYVFDKEIDYLELHSTYITQRGRIVTYQIWDVPDMFSFTLTGYKIYDENDGIYYSIENNGSIYCKRVLKDSIITVYSDGSYSLTDLVEMIKNG